MTTIAVVQDLGVPAETFERLAQERIGECEIRWVTGQGDLAQRCRGVDVIVTVNAPVDGAALQAIRPRLVAISFTGHDHVDVQQARRLDVAVTNVPSYATDSVAELAVCMILSLARHVVSCDAAVRAGRWREGLTGTELAGRTVGVVGTGSTGIAVARRLAAFDCPLLGFSRSPRPGFETLGGTYVPLHELLRRSDVVTLHVPLTPETRGMIGAHELSLMPTHALLVNTARGPVVDTAALARALIEGRIGGAAVDVYDAEPMTPDNPLREAPRTLLLPHVAFATGEALERKAAITADCIAAFLRGEKLNRID